MSLKPLPNAAATSAIYQYPNKLHKSNALAVQKESLDAPPQRFCQNIFECTLAQAKGPSAFDFRKTHVFNSLPRLQQTVEKVAATAFHSPTQIEKDKIASKTWNDHRQPSSKNSSSRENYAADNIAFSIEPMRSSLEDPLHRVKEILNEWVSQQEIGENRVRAGAEILDFLNNPRKTELKLQHLGLRSLPEIFDKEPFISSLRNLSLLNNRFTSLPKHICQLRNLRELDLSRNLLTSLPEQIGQLQQLEVLWLSNNQLRSLSEHICQLKQLKKLYLYTNCLRSLPLKINQLQNLIALDLSENELTSLPDQIGKLEKLITLDLSKNELTSLPDRIGKLEKLTILDLSKNKLTSLPKGIGKLKKLTTLDLSENELTSLPDRIGKLEKLTTLDLSKNKLTSPPKGIGKLEKLTTLDLSENKLTSPPKRIGKLKELIVLNLSNNQLTSPPKGIGKLKELIVLNLSNNQLTSPPEGIDKLNKLITLDLNNNPNLQSRPNELPHLLGNCIIDIQTPKPREWWGLRRRAYLTQKMVKT